MATNCKFQKTQYQVSYDSGATWQDVVPVQYGKGELIEYDSVDCTSINTLYRWRTLDGQYICDGNNKYVKEIREESYDNGVTWYVSYPTVYQQGSYVGVDTNFCCTKFVGHYEISKDAPDGCPSYYKWNGYRCVYIDPLKVVKCDGTTTLTSADTKYYQSGYTIVDAEIGESITAIGAKGFYGCSGLTNIDMPSGLTVIGSYAFQHCSGLTSVEMPSSIRTISASAFYNCNSLTSITVNATTPPALGANAFLSTNNCPIYVPCDSLFAYLTDNNWKLYTNRLQGMQPCASTYKYKALYYGGISYSASCDGDTNLTSATTRPSGYNYWELNDAEIGVCVSNIEHGLFSIESSLSSITVDNRNTIYDSRNNCNAIIETSTNTLIQGCKNTVIPNTVTSIGEKAFYQCTQLTNIDIPNTVTSIGKLAFWNSYSLTSCTIGSGVTSIGSQAFQDCRSLTTINIPSGVTFIGSSAFFRCSALTSVNIPNGVTSIYIGTFSKCTSLSSITIPNSVTSIGYGAFMNCSGLTSITVNAMTPPTLGSAAFDNTNNCPIYVPSSVVSTYKSASGWSNYASRIQAIP